MAEHVTFFRMKVQPGKLDELIRLMSDEPENSASAGFEAAIVGKSKDDPNTIWAAVSWDTSERYYANAQSPEQNAEYEKMRALLEADPEWFDCDVVQELQAGS
jgi:heme-degrading monooxygenase HmoA